MGTKPKLYSKFEILTVIINCGLYLDKIKILTEKRIYIKQLLDEVFVISRIIKVEVEVIIH